MGAGADRQARPARVLRLHGEQPPGDRDRARVGPLEQALGGEAAGVHGRAGQGAGGPTRVSAFTNSSSCAVVQHPKAWQWRSYAAMTESP